MSAIARKIAFTLLVLAVSAYLTFSWFTSPFTMEMLGEPLAVQRSMILVCAGALVASWLYTFALAAETYWMILAYSKYDEVTEVKD